MSLHLPDGEWEGIGSGGRPVSFADVVGLARCDSDGDADNYYWRLDGTVCENGELFAPAGKVVRTILALLPSSSPEGRRRCLELLGQIAVARDAQGAAGVWDECLEELSRALWVFLGELQFSTPEDAWLYIDLVGVLAATFRPVHRLVVGYLEWFVVHGPGEDYKELARNTIREIQVRVRG